MRPRDTPDRSARKAAAAKRALVDFIVPPSLDPVAVPVPAGRLTPPEQTGEFIPPEARALDVVFQKLSPEQQALLMQGAEEQTDRALLQQLSQMSEQVRGIKMRLCNSCACYCRHWTPLPILPCITRLPHPDAQHSCCSAVLSTAQLHVTPPLTCDM